MDDFLIYTIDDDQDFNMILKMAMKKYGLSVKTHENVTSFTSSVKEKTPSLCILDLNLQEKGGEGFQLLQAMRNIIGEDLPIFVMSRRGDRDDVLKAMELGASDFIPKPLDEYYLALKLKKFIPKEEFRKIVSENFALIPKNDDKGFAAVGFEVKRIALDGFTLESSAGFARESHIELKGDFLNEIFGKVQLLFKVVSVETMDNSFQMQLTRDWDDDEYLALRKYLFQKVMGESRV